MPDFKQLKNDPKNRKIRDIVMSAGETIKIFEPTSSQLDDILSFQEKWFQNENIEIDGIDVARILIPMLTDITGLETMSDEEIGDIIDNPSNALLQVQNHIETIVTEVYKTIILSARKKLLEADLNVEAYKVNEETFDRAIALASKEKGINNLAEKFENAADEVIKADQERQAEGIIALKDYSKEVESKVDKYNEMLKQRRADFNEVDE